METKQWITERAPVRTYNPCDICGRVDTLQPGFTTEGKTVKERTQNMRWACQRCFKLRHALFTLLEKNVISEYSIERAMLDIE